MLDRADGFRCVSQYANAEDALKDLPQVRPDVVLMDINLPGMNGVECVRQLKPLLPQTQVMMLTVYEDTENIFNALTAGANGYMLKRTSSKELLEAIQEVHRGGSPMTMHIARKVVQSFQQTAATAQPDGKSFPARTAGARFFEPGTYVQGNRGQTRHQLRNRPHLHPPHLRKIAGPHPDRSRGQISPALTEFQRFPFVFKGFALVTRTGDWQGTRPLVS